MNKNTYILVNKSSNGDNNIQCMRRLILGIVLTGSRIRQYGDVPIIYSTVFSLTDQWSPNVRRFRRSCRSLNVVHGSAVAQNGGGNPRSFARSHSRSWQSRLRLQDVQRWRWHGHSWQHRLADGTRFFSRLSLMFSRSNLFSFSSISGNSMPYISCSKSGSVSGFLVLSHSFQNVQSCISNHSVPQITVSVVRQMAHNMHIAYIASCIHVKLKIATML